MTENKKNEAQTSPEKPTVPCAATGSTETTEQKTTCPVLYPSEPYTSNK